MEKDVELRDFLTKVIITITILVICIVLFVFAMINKNGLREGKLSKIVSNEEDAIILFRKNECSNCDDIEAILKDNSINFVVFNTDTERYINTNLELLNLSRSDIVEPTIVYIKEGKVYSTLVNIKKNNDLNEYLEYNNLSN